MAVSTAYTLEEAREMLQMWKDCEKALASGTVKSYRIGTRELTMLDIDEITRQINRYSNMVDALSGKVSTSRVRCVVPRDL